METSVQLDSVPLFSGLAPSDLEAIRQAAQARSVRAGEFFFMQGDPSERLFWLIQGQVRLQQVTQDGQQILLRVATPGALFGGMALLPNTPYPVNALAAADSQAWSWTQHELMGWAQRMPRLALNALQMMADHAQAFQDRYRELATERVERRLARAVLRLAAQSGRRTPQGVLIDFPLSRQDLAEMTGTTLYTVSRTLSSWEERGLVLLGRERLTVRYPHGLVRIAEDLPEP